MNAYGRKGHVRKKPYPHTHTNKKEERKKEQTTNAYGKERKNRPQMLMANEIWLS